MPKVIKRFILRICPNAALGGCASYANAAPVDFVPLHLPPEALDGLVRSFAAPVTSVAVFCLACYVLAVLRGARIRAARSEAGICPETLLDQTQILARFQSQTLAEHQLQMAQKTTGAPG